MPWTDYELKVALHALFMMLSVYLCHVQCLYTNNIVINDSHQAIFLYNQKCKLYWKRISDLHNGLVFSRKETGPFIEPKSI